MGEEKRVVMGPTEVTGPRGGGVSGRWWDGRRSGARARRVSAPAGATVAGFLRPVRAAVLAVTVLAPTTAVPAPVSALLLFRMPLLLFRMPLLLCWRRLRRSGGSLMWNRVSITPRLWPR